MFTKSSLKLTLQVLITSNFECIDISTHYLIKINNIIKQN